ncbi:hypothetical protein AB1I92_24785 [Bacillus mobilis]|uniref:Uncharacterized protein n=1 Tax=Bacillus mobilis TaxID=2026190 RepID=A0ABV4RZL1_9BACI|nr:MULTISPECIES: hypothetical protein [Bacillus cereus group]MCC2462966.1 hypothetical protein [Bacillus mobilis]MCU5433988.1 hypothetical protein [Bacillus mobilis]MCU5595543.1 hypothetical protein [Bacillus mobilis]MCU5736967.1 hypothetical protein [Bacillus mobilis]MCU9560730.1 hypothetical protein [Bacillus mobilis]
MKWLNDSKASTHEYLACPLLTDCVSLGCWSKGNCVVYVGCGSRCANYSCGVHIG